MKKEWIKKINEIRTSEDLVREKLSLSDYHTLGQVVAYGRVTVISYGVANWFKRNGAYVESLDTGRYLISL